MTDYHFPENIVQKPLSRDSDHRGGSIVNSLHERIQFAINSITVTPERISATLLLTHTGTQPLDVKVLPCGGAPFPYGGSSPFLLQLDYTDKTTQEAVRYTGVLYPPAPPPPVVLKIPPTSRTHFTAEIDLTSYTYQGTPEIRLAWFFCLYGSTSIRGAFPVRLRTE